MITNFWALTAWTTVATVIVISTIWALLRSAERRLALKNGWSSRVSAGTLIVVASWAVVVFILGWNGMFEARPYAYFPFIALGITVPLLGGYLFLSRSFSLNRVLDQVPQRWLVSVQLYRALGVIFLILYSANMLPGVFAMPAGIGDLLVGISAPLVAYACAMGYRRSCLVTFLWNLFGIADLVLAVILGFLSSPGPFQLLALKNPNVMITSFPLVLIPTFDVPLSLVLHLASLKKLRQSLMQQDNPVRKFEYCPESQVDECFNRTR